jgi:formate-nitrite transporter family protein
MSAAGTPISEEEIAQVEERQRPRSAVIFETIRREGEETYERAAASLFWSAVAAGGSMTFSMITMGVLVAHMPDTPARHLVASLGYTVGFLIVILGRQQLFTENTLTPLLPMFYEPTLSRFAKLVRLWALILAGNLVAALGTSALVAFSGAFPNDALTAFDQLARDAANHPFWVLFTKAIFAGWLIALMVWLLPLAENAAVFVIIILTYVVAAADFGHIIAGSVEAFYGAWHGAIGWGGVVAFIIPTLLGNSVGGVAFVAAVSTAEIASERGELGRNPGTGGTGEDKPGGARKPAAT